MSTRYAHGLGRVAHERPSQSGQLRKLPRSVDEPVKESSGLRRIVVRVTDYDRARLQGVCPYCGHFCGHSDRVLAESVKRMRSLLERLDRGEVALPQRAIRTELNIIRDWEAGRLPVGEVRP